MLIIKLKKIELLDQCKLYMKENTSPYCVIQQYPRANTDQNGGQYPILGA